MKQGDLGRCAYDAYCVKREWKAFDGKPLPQWEEVKPEIQDAWEYAATTAINYFLNNAILT